MRSVFSFLATARRLLRGRKRLTPLHVWRSVPLPFKAGGAFIALGLVGLFMISIVLVAFSAASISAMTSVVDRIPGSTWFSDSQPFQRSDSDDAYLADITREDAEAVRQELEEQPDLVRCLGDAPPVQGPAPTLFIASEEEKMAIIEHQNTKQGRDVPRPPGSVSAHLDPELISTQPAVIPSGQQIMDGPRAVSQVNEVINDVPSGTDVGTAQTFLVVAFAGGVVNWQHFSTILDASDIARIDPGQSIDTAAQFFGPEVDFAPYVPAVNAALISLSTDQVIDGSVNAASRGFSDCTGG